MDVALRIERPSTHFSCMARTYAFSLRWWHSNSSVRMLRRTIRYRYRHVNPFPFIFRSRAGIAAENAPAGQRQIRAKSVRGSGRTGDDCLPVPASASGSGKDGFERFRDPGDLRCRPLQDLSCVPAGFDALAWLSSGPGNSQPALSRNTPPACLVVFRWPWRRHIMWTEIHPGRHGSLFPCLTPGIDCHFRTPVILSEEDGWRGALALPPREACPVRACGKIRVSTSTPPSRRFLFLQHCLRSLPPCA